MVQSLLPLLALVAASGAPAEPPLRRPLAGTSWVLVELQSMDDTTLKPTGGARYALTFDGDGILRVQCDCNRGRATWRSPDDVALEIGPLALTRAQCPPSPLQDRFARDLGFVRSYVVRDGNLYLSLMADGGIYAFEPVPPQP
jgi:para-nitrobenzyl esterase